jgi:hypothetical protein
MLTVTHKFVSPKSEQTDPTLVGPNEWNASHTVVNTTGPLYAADYAFLAQAPGGTLTIGSNIITLSPIPSGLAIGNYLYITGGVGTAEAVPITAWNSTTGQVIVTCAYTHSGAWTIQSATAGIAEAMTVLNGPGKIILPATSDLYTGVTLAAGTIIEGAGNATSNLSPFPCLVNFHSTTGIAFTIIYNNCTIANIRLVQVSGTATAGCGIYIYYNGNAVTGVYDVTLSGVEIEQFYNGLIGDGTYAAQFINVQCYNNANYGFVLNGVQGPGGINLQAVGNKSDGFHIGSATNNGNPTFALSGGGTYNNGGWGINCVSAFTQISNMFLNNDALGEVCVNGPSAYGPIGILSNLNIQYAGYSTSWTNSATAPGIRVTSTSGPILATNIAIFTTKGNAIDILNGYNHVTNTYSVGGGTGLVAGNTYCLNVQGVGNTLIGILTSGTVAIAGSANKIIGCSFSNGGAAAALTITSGTDIVLSGNYIYGATIAASISAGVTVLEGANEFIGTVTSSAVTSTYSSKLGGDILKTCTFSQLGTINPASRPMLVFCTDATPGSKPATGGGTGAMVWWNTGLAEWVASQ